MMETFIIYAALILGSYSTTIEFKQASFTKVEECKTYLEENKGIEFITLMKNSAIFNEARRKYFLEATNHLRSFANMIEGIYTCPKCGSKKTNTIQKQTRSSDEPTTEINSCVCGNVWRTPQ